MFFLQQKYNMRAETFVAQTAFIQGATLLTMGPILDRAITGSWVFDLFLNEDPTVPGTAFYVAVSAAVAIAVNVSQAAAIGAASALGACRCNGGCDECLSPLSLAAFSPLLCAAPAGASV